MNDIPINFTSSDWRMLEMKLKELVAEEVEALKTPMPLDVTNLVRGKIAAYEEILNLSNQ